MKHLAARDAVQIGVQFRRDGYAAPGMAVADFLGLLAVMPADPFPVVRQEQVVEILHLLERGDPDLGMLAQHLRQPACPGLLRPDAQRAGLSRLARRIQYRAKAAQRSLTTLLWEWLE